MELKDEVCSLELGQKLKELGVKQKSLFYWCKIRNKNKWELRPEIRVFGVEIFRNKYYDLPEISAFTVAELGEMLIDGRSGNEMPRGFWCSHKNDDGEQQWAKTEANARAKMLIHLIENNFISI